MPSARSSSEPAERLSAVIPVGARSLATMFAEIAEAEDALAQLTGADRAAMQTELAEAWEGLAAYARTLAMAVRRRARRQPQRAPLHLVHSAPQSVA